MQQSHAHTFTAQMMPAQSLPVRDVAILDRIFTLAEGPGVGTLRAQLPYLSIAPSSTTTYREFSVRAGAPRSAVVADADGLLPGVFEVTAPSGRAIGEFVVALDDGIVSALEYVWYDERHPLMMPSPIWLRFQPVDATPLAANPRGAHARSARFTVQSRLRWPVLGIVVVSVVLAFALGQGGGADLGAARAQGARAGTAQGTAAGTAVGRAQGTAEGQSVNTTLQTREERALAFEQARADSYAAATKVIRANQAASSGADGAPAASSGDSSSGSSSAGTNHG